MVTKDTSSMELIKLSLIQISIEKILSEIKLHLVKETYQEK